MADIQGIIDRIMSDERLKRSSHFSQEVFGNEPIIRTGRQMSSYLPDRYREMRAISRWQEGADGGRGRWLTEAELFARQAEFMADFEDDCPYRGDFKAYFPTYAAMSDRQLRGYFTWRSRVRAGDVQDAPASFAYLYLYELIGGVGYSDPAEGLALMRGFCEAFGARERGILRLAEVWMQDFAVYHGLPAELLGDTRRVRHDRALAGLGRATDAALAARERHAAGRGRRAPKGLPLPAERELEDGLLAALDDLSSYRIRSGKLCREQPEAVAHVAGSVWVRLADHYARSRKTGVMESMFGGSAELPYTMFASAVFFERRPHPDADYELDPIHRYRCRDGLWTCERVHGAVGRSSRLGSALRAVDGRLRGALGFGRPLKEEQVPKYLAAIIDAEAAAWASWREAHAPRRIDIDLGRLAGIRTAAAQTREALLIDEEREGAGAMLDAARGACGDGGDLAAAPGAAPRASEGYGPARSGARPVDEDPGARPGTAGPAAGAPLPGAAADPAPAESTAGTRPGCTDATEAAPAPDPQGARGGPEAGCGRAPARDAFLRALLDGDAPRAAAAARGAGTSVDLLADAVNEELFDAVGDTVVEFAAEGPRIVEDYREDIEELLSHG